MTNIDRRGVANVLGRIKTYHSPQDIGEAVITSWSDAFTFAGVTNLEDAVKAVVRHYTTPGANPWITPGDVVGHYRDIQADRLRSLPGDEVLMAGVDNDDPNWPQIKASRVDEWANGTVARKQLTSGGPR